MEIVINIDEDTYKDIKKGKVYSSMRDVPQESVLAIANGKLLPKGHGRLIDADALIYSLSSSDRDIYCKGVIEEEAPTIIEGSENE